MSLKKMGQIWVAIAAMSAGLAFGQVTGSGFFITTDGYFVTNQHVVDAAKKVAIRTVNGKTYPAEVVRVDTANDLAILKAEGTFRALPVQTSQNVRRGDKVFTLGFPNTDVQGVEPKYTEGVISSLTGIRDEPNNFQISVSLQPGNSGGPLISSLGNVVGIVAAKLSAAAMVKSGRSLPENVNYAVKSNYLLELISTLPSVRGGMSAVRTKPTESMSDLATLAEAAVGLVVVELEKGQSKAALPQSKSPPAAMGRGFKDCDNCPEMVVIPAGSFDMGGTGADQTPVHRVMLELFYMGKTEVTQGQWKAVMGSNPSRFKNCGDSCPVESVSWDDAKQFASRLSAKTGKSYRLPSEAEWEYACRAGGREEYCGSGRVDEVGWHNSNSGHSIRPVAGKEANAFGLYDMSGNVFELTEDCWNANYWGAPTDGSAWTTGECFTRVARGGSWEDGPLNLRSVSRDRSVASYGQKDFGFRVARDN